MRYTIYLLLVSLFAVSCSEDDVKDAVSHSQTLTLDKKFFVQLSETDPKTFSAQETFDASLSGFTLTDVEVESMTFEVTGYVGDASVGDVTLEEATFTFVGTNPEVSLAISGLNLAEAFGTPFELADAFDATAIAAIKAAVVENEAVTVSMSAMVDKVPANFEITLTFVLKVTAGAS